MIIGSGLIAHAFRPFYAHSDRVCLYAAGVSNSGCTDDQEFARERERLTAALQQAQQMDAFVYFGTCSVADPEVRGTPYVQHKLAMEQLVAAHPRYLILRLPQVAGITPNPHTLLNFLYAHIARSEAFQLWRNARRDIIDVDDVAAIARQLIDDPAARCLTVNIACPENYAMTDIVATMERVVGKRAIYKLVERGTGYQIDTHDIQPLLDKAGVQFGTGYLERVIGKYYAKAD
ncbi:MAG: NAD-dependent epimerase/dehydratase family protein [Gallionella sp.]|nr:NAD-dependent epimerase/dehydratase family protein [Gallionella sp.]MDD4945460.1 NAD-dependent epimerase/dehydratase family protein [Gallionella sp.]MDD5612388.1 NAD-dependent epimerase/dehydratase family protein [Gallionella sp.]